MTVTRLTSLRHGRQRKVYGTVREEAVVIVDPTNAPHDDIIEKVGLGEDTRFWEDVRKVLFPEKL